jgi:hypothetical protein
MKILATSTETAKHAVIALALCFGLASHAGATTVVLSQADAYYVGDVTTGTPNSPTDRLTYVNNLTGLAPSTSGDVISGHTYDRSSNFASLLAAATEVKGGNGAGTITLSQTYEYLLQKYGGNSSGGDLVWYIGNLPAGTMITVPGTASFGSKAYTPNSYALFTPVPLPAAAWLLLSGLAGVGAMARRRRNTTA